MLMTMDRTLLEITIFFSLSSMKRKERATRFNENTVSANFLVEKYFYLKTCKQTGKPVNINLGKLYCLKKSVMEQVP